MSSTFVWILILIMEYFASSINSLYFHISESEEKCFLQELPQETLLVGRYKCQLHSEGSNISPITIPVGIKVEIHSPHKKILLSRWYGAKGKFSFISHQPGEHKICMMNFNSTKRFSGRQIRIYLDLQTGDHAINYTSVATKKKLNELQIKLQQLIDQVKQISREQDYQRYREEMFRGTTEHISKRILLWSIGQTLILLIMGAWQMQHFKEFIESKKLV